jgi:hypothetical protein
LSALYFSVFSQGTVVTNYSNPCIALTARLIKIESRCEMIKKVKEGYKVLSEKTGKNLGGPYKTKAEAEKRLRQVEFFKHRKG